MYIRAVHQWKKTWLLLILIEKIVFFRPPKIEWNKWSLVEKETEQVA
jgi:hypothetical protein